MLSEERGSTTPGGLYNILYLAERNLALFLLTVVSTLPMQAVQH